MTVEQDHLVLKKLRDKVGDTYTANMIVGVTLAIKRPDIANRILAAYTSTSDAQEVALVALLKKRDAVVTEIGRMFDEVGNQELAKGTTVRVDTRLAGTKAD